MFELVSVAHACGLAYLSFDAPRQQQVHFVHLKPVIPRSMVAANCVPEHFFAALSQFSILAIRP